VHDRVNTRNLLTRKTFYLESYNCALMNCQHEETLFHMFWGCTFAERCWDFVCPNRDNPSSIWEALVDLKAKLGLPFFMEIIIIASWAIWISRNNLIFQQIQPSFQRWKEIYLLELSRFRLRSSSFPFLFLSFSFLSFFFLLSYPFVWLSSSLDVLF
jgi:hypothetical protein